MWCRNRASFVLAVSGRPSNRGKEPTHPHQLFKFRADKGYTVPGECILQFPDEPALAFPASHYQYSVYPTIWYLSLPVMLNPSVSGIVHSVIQDSRSLSCHDHLRILIKDQKQSQHLKIQRFCLKGSTEQQEEIFRKWRKRNIRERQTHLS